MGRDSFVVVYGYVGLLAHDAFYLLIGNRFVTKEHTSYIKGFTIR